MKLSRKNIYNLGLASQIFDREAVADEALPKDKRVLHINVTARMFIRKNAKEISEMFEMVKEEEANIAEKHVGHFISSLGYTQFFATNEDRESFQKVEPEFIKALTSLKEMANGLLQKDPSMSAQLDKDFNNLRTKYIQPGDAAKARKNLEAYQTAFKQFLEDAEGIMDFKVHPIKAKWFENTNSLPQAFIDHYEEAGLISYDE